MKCDGVDEYQHSPFSVVYSFEVPDHAYLKAAHPRYGFITDQNIDELRRVFNRKFPHSATSIQKRSGYPTVGR